MSEINLSVRIRPSKWSPSVDVVDGSSPSQWKTSSPAVVVFPNKEAFHYPSHVVKGSDQVVAFNALASKLIERACAGYNCTLMAYGQTGSGKTHTSNRAQLYHGCGHLAR